MEVGIAAKENKGWFEAKGYLQQPVYGHRQCLIGLFFSKGLSSGLCVSLPVPDFELGFSVVGMGVAFSLPRTSAITGFTGLATAAVISGLPMWCIIRLSTTTWAPLCGRPGRATCRQVCFLVVAAADRLSSGDDLHHANYQPVVPVLDTYRGDQEGCLMLSNWFSIRLLTTRSTILRISNIWTRTTQVFSSSGTASSAPFQEERASTYRLTKISIPYNPFRIAFNEWGQLLKRRGRAPSHGRVAAGYLSSPPG